MKKGFTLVEVLTTVTILTLGIIFTHQALSRCISAIQRSEETLLCSLVAERALTAIELQNQSDSKSLSYIDLQNFLTFYPGYKIQSSFLPVSLNQRTFNECILEVRGPHGAFVKSSVLLNFAAEDQRLAIEASGEPDWPSGVVVEGQRR